MDNLEVPDELIARLLRQTDGSAMQREKVSVQVRQRLLTAAVPPANGPEVTAAAVHPSGGPLPRIAAQLPKLENFCLITGVTIENRLSQVVSAALEGSAKLWWRFIGDFGSWDDFKTGFRAEFASIDAKRRLKDELRNRTQHPEENLKEFIYTIDEFYERIGEEVPDSENVDRVLRQMHPQLQDLAEGTQYANWSELAKATDGLMECAWRRLQYKPPPTRSNQVARDLAFRAQDNSDFPGTEAAIPATLAPALAAAVSSATVAMPSTYHWPLHPAAIKPANYRDQLSGHTTSGGVADSVLPMSQCGGIGHPARSCATGRRLGPGLCFRCQQPGHFQAQCPGNGHW
ncbi:hypothetical protein HPB47_023864 [Ixodes persulcatus]|uniref:Uncharacterized protein n=1 Tax=Ixodes persulcatus TaxID=34615 RepID=A0AC60Q6Y9_IXOPE|nr:hypothetical protein HPB47_023864 [Ixodes persulcatus]